MFSTSGAIILGVVVGLCAIAYFALPRGAGKTEQDPGQPPAQSHVLPPAAEQKPAPAQNAAPAAGMTSGDRARVKIDRRDRFGPAVARMNEDQAMRGAFTTQTFVGDSGYAANFGGDGNDYTANLVGGLGGSVIASHAKYVDELTKSRGKMGPQGRVTLHSGYGADFTQAPENFTGLWSMLRGRSSLEGAHSTGQAQMDSVAHCVGEDGFARLIGRPQYLDNNTTTSQNLSPLSQEAAAYHAQSATTV